MGMMGVSTAAPMTSTMMAHPGAVPAAGVAGMPVMTAAGQMMPGQVAMPGAVMPGMPVASVAGMMPVTTVGMIPGAAVVPVSKKSHE